MQKSESAIKGERRGNREKGKEGGEEGNCEEGSKGGREGEGKIGKDEKWRRGNRTEERREKKVGDEGKTSTKCLRRSRLRTGKRTEEIDRGKIYGKEHK